MHSLKLYSFQACELLDTGTLLAVGREVLHNSQDGHMLKTKVLETTEGGLCHGSGAVDSPNLLPMEQFVGVVTKTQTLSV